MSPALAQEWRQFRLLVRTSFGRLMDTAVASREIDAAQYVIWGFALLASPVFFHAAKMMGRYNFLIRRPDVLERLVSIDRLFFVVYVMLACALLAAVLWEALFPDRQDQEIVGVLPVRQRTLAAARLTAALVVVTLFAGTVALPSGVMYSLTVGTAFKSMPIVGWAPAVVVAHMVTVTAAGVFTFSTLLALRGLAVACVGAEAVQRAATVLQLATVLLLVETFLFLPTVLERLSAPPEAAAGAVLLPPVWFLGLYSAMSGASPQPVDALAGVALVGTAASVLAAGAIYLLPARWNARRCIEARLANRAGRSIAVADRLAAPVLRQPASRAVFRFVLASLARSRRHALVVATYLGIGLSVAGIRLMRAALRGRPLTLDAPVDYLISIPLVLTFFLVLGLRSAFRVPTDVEANWTFQIAQPPSTGPWVHGVGVALVVVAVLPVTVGWFIVAASLWGDIRTACGAAVMHAASGAMLVQLVLIKCQSVPFTRPHAPASSGLQAGWFFVLLALLLYAYTLDDLQLLAMRTPRGISLYVIAMVTVILGAQWYRRARRASWSLRFDSPVEPDTQALNLSQALG